MSPVPLTLQPEPAGEFGPAWVSKSNSDHVRGRGTWYRESREGFGERTLGSLSTGDDVFETATFNEQTCAYDRQNGMGHDSHHRVTAGALFGSCQLCCTRLAAFSALIVPVIVAGTEVRREPILAEWPPDAAGPCSTNAGPRGPAVILSSGHIRAPVLSKRDQELATLRCYNGNHKRPMSAIAPPCPVSMVPN
jgi:hypothetical protein